MTQPNQPRPPQPTWGTPPPAAPSWTPPPANPGWGAPAPGPSNWGQPTVAPQTDGKAIAALVVGIASCCIWLVPFIGPFLMLGAGPTALVLGIISMRAINASGGRLSGKGMAITGVVLGSITTGLILLGIIVFVIALATGANFLEDLCEEQPDNPACDEFAGESRAPGSPPWATVGDDVVASSRTILQPLAAPALRPGLG